MTNRFKGGNGFLVAMGTSTTAGLIFPQTFPEITSDSHCTPAPEISPLHETEIRVLFSIEETESVLHLVPSIFFSLFFSFLYFAGLMILPDIRVKNIYIYGCCIRCFDSISNRNPIKGGNVRTNSRHSLCSSNFDVIFFFLSGNLELCEKSSLVRLISIVN